MIKLIILDMDGVIFEGCNFWLDLHRALGTEKQALQLWKNLSKTDYKQLSYITAKLLWRHKSADIFWRLVGNRKSVTGVSRVFEFARANAIKTAIVSTGPYQLAERAQKMYGINIIRANRLEISANGTFTGNVDVQVDENHKNEVALEIINQLGVPAKFTAMIGDSVSDASMAKVVGLPIAYDTEDEELLENCVVHIPRGHLSDVIVTLSEHCTVDYL